MSLDEPPNHTGGGECCGPYAEEESQFIIAPAVTGHQPKAKPAYDDAEGG